jgi:hypothetical protein
MEEYCTYYINNKVKKSPRAYNCNTWKFCNIEKETPLLTPQRIILKYWDPILENVLGHDKLITL